MDPTTETTGGAGTGARQTRLGRAARREQILAAATEVFARAGEYATTGLDDVARQAGVTRMILYRHFASKHDLYQAAIDRAAERLHEAATDESGELGEHSVPGMVAWAAADPSCFLLLFDQAPRQPEFRTDTASLRSTMVSALGSQRNGDAGPWDQWIAELATATVIEGIKTWLDLGCPDGPEHATTNILRVIDGIYQASPRNTDP